MNDQEHFLKRWSRRKSEAKELGEGDKQGPATAADAGAPVLETPDPEPADRQQERVQTEDDFADVDFEALNAQSDYSRFLAKGVPDSIKYKALRKLWGSDALYSQIDPFQDYAGDFTDAAVAVPAGTLKTAYRVGKGFMTDEEVAEWEKLGKPPEEETAGAAAPEAEERIALDRSGGGDKAETPRPAEAGAGERQLVAGSDEAQRDGAGSKDGASTQPAAVPTDSPAKADADRGKA